MTRVAQGGTATLDAVITDGTGSPADATGITLTVATSAGVPVAGFPVVSPAIVHSGVGTYTYAWAVGIGQAVGFYTATWSGTVDGGAVDGYESVEVVTPASLLTDTLTTLAECRSRIPSLAVSDTSPDSYLLDFIGTVTDEITRYTGRQFWPTSGATAYFDPDDEDELAVPIGIRAVTSMACATTDQPDDGSGTGYVAVTASHIYLNPPATRRTHGWPATEVKIGSLSGVYMTEDRLRSVKIVGDFGWAATPPVIRRIATDAVMAMYGARSSGSTSRLVTTPDGASFRFLRYIPAEDRETLDAFRTFVGAW